MYSWKGVRFQRTDRVRAFIFVNNPNLGGCNPNQKYQRLLFIYFMDEFFVYLQIIIQYNIDHSRRIIRARHYWF